MVVKRMMLVLAISFLVPLGAAAEQPNQPTPKQRRQAQEETRKRQWLHQRVVRPVRDPRVRQQYEAQLNRASGQQLDALIRQYNVALAQRRRWQQMQRYYGRPVGFAPVIT